MRDSRSIVFVLLLLCLAIVTISCGGNSGSSGSTTTGGGTTGGSNPVPSTVTFAFVGSVGGTLNSTGPITGFAVASDGSAAAISNSPFTGANKSLIASGKFLVGSDGINLVSYSIASNGSLSQASSISGVAHNDIPNDSAVGALSMDRSGSSVYAGEINFQGADNDAIAMFNLGSDGKLTFLKNSDINVNFGGDLKFTTDNKFAYGTGCFFLGFNLFGFQRNADGTLTRLPTDAASPEVPADLAGFCPGPLSASSTGLLAALIFSEGNGVSQVSIILYRINGDGSLTLVNNSLVSAPTAVDIDWDPSGTFLAAATSTGMQMYRLSGTTLTALGPAQDASVSFDHVQWDSSGHLYGLSSKSNALYIYTANQGALSPAPGSPHSVTSPGSLALAPAGSQ